MSTNTPTPAGWYPSERQGQLRYWDGARWTEHYQPAQATPAQPATPQQPEAQAPEAAVPAIPTAPQQFAPPMSPQPAAPQQPMPQAPTDAPAHGQAVTDAQAPSAPSAPFGQVPPYGTAAPGFAPAPEKKKGLGKGAIAGIVAGAVVVAGGAVWGGIALFGGAGGASGCPTPDAAIFDDLAESGGAEGISAPELADSSALSPAEIQSLFSDACVYTASGEVGGELGAATTGEMAIALSSDDVVDPQAVADTFEEAGWSDLGALAALGGEDTAGMGMWIDGDMSSLMSGETTSTTMAIGMELEAAKEQMTDEQREQLESSFPGADYMLVVVSAGE